MTVLLNPYRFANAPVYDAAAQAYFAAMTNDPDEAHKARLDTFVQSIKAAGPDILSRLVLWWYAGHDAQAARINLGNPGGVKATTVNSPTFTPYKGFAGNAATMAVNCGILNNAVPGVTKDKIAWGIGVNAHSANTQFIWGLTATGTVNTVQTSSVGTRGWRCNSFGSFNTAAGPLVGRYMAVRSNDSNFNAYFNGELISNIASSSATLPAIEMSVLRTGSNFSSAQASYLWVGALNDTESLAVDAAIAVLTASLPSS